MVLPNISDFKRAYAILFHPPKISDVTDFKLLKRDVEIAKLAQEILPYITFVALVGLTYYSFTLVIPAIILSGVIFTISFVSTYRFSRFEHKVERDIDPREFALASMDWGVCVPDIDSRPITERSNYENSLEMEYLEKIILMERARFTPHNRAREKIIEKSWEYALKQNNAKDLLFLCHKCEGYQSKTSLMAIRFDDGVLKLPSYYTAYLKKKEEYASKMEDKGDEIVLKGVLMKQFLYKIVKEYPFVSEVVSSYDSHQVDPFEKWRHFFPLSFNEIIALLPTLDGSSDEDIPLRSIFQSKLQLSKSNLQDPQTVAKLKEAKVTEVILGADVIETDLSHLDGLNLRVLHFKYRKITELGLRDVLKNPLKVFNFLQTTNDGLKLIADCKTIEELVFENRNVDASGIRRLNALPHLWSLTITGKPLDADSVGALEEIHSLEHLTVVSTQAPKAPVEPVKPSDEALRDQATNDEYEGRKAKYDVLKVEYDVKKGQYDYLKAQYGELNRKNPKLKISYV